MFAIDDILEFRRQNRETSAELAEAAKRNAIRAANEAAAQALLDAERAHLRRCYDAATSDDERLELSEELDLLDRLERRA